MPQRTTAEKDPPSSKFKNRQAHYLANCAKINAKEADLKRLKEDESRLGLITAKVSGPAAGAHLTSHRTTGAQCRAIAQTVQGIRCSWDSRIR